MVAGNCRICLVEVEKSPKPVASCAIPLIPNIKIYTDSPLVRKAREGVVEFLLINHPLDCPICDQGGECDLQDQTISYGGDRSRFFQTYKRGVEDKDCGPLIQTIITRCISCSRCVRFASEIAGEGSLGITNRGVGVEVGTYIPKLLRSEISGNLIDLCPVGALTSKPYAFKARPWELVDTDSIDTIDSLGSHIRTQTRGNDVLRILPVKNDAINQDWISDKTRFCLDAFNFGRNINFKTPVELLTLLSDNLGGSNEKGLGIQFVVGPHVGAETLNSIEQFTSRFNCNNILVSDYKKSINIDQGGSYTLNGSLADIENSDCILLVGNDLKQELPLLNARLRSSFLRDNSTIITISSNSDSGFPVASLGLGVDEFTSFIEGRHE